MAEPLDAIMAIHNAFRHDMSIIDTAALGIGARQTGARANARALPLLQRNPGLARPWRGS